jgi:hypothetical protein
VFVIVLFVQVMELLSVLLIKSSARFFPMLPASGVEAGRRKASLQPCRFHFCLREGCFSVSCGTIVMKIQASYNICYYCYKNYKFD